MNKLSCQEENSHAVPDQKIQQPDKSGFRKEWHDAKEIVVPFDESSLSCMLVSQKDFAEAYAPKSPRPPVVGLRPESERNPGSMGFSASFLSGMGSPAGSELPLLVKLLMVWTPALLLLGAFPLSRWVCFTLVSTWIALVWLFYRFGSRSSVSWLVWAGSILATLAWGGSYWIH